MIFVVVVVVVVVVVAVVVVEYIYMLLNTTALTICSYWEKGKISNDNILKYI